MNLSNRGYSILKENISSNELHIVRKELTVKPYVNQDFQAPPNPFAIYGESKRKLYVPRFYGINKFGTPNNSKLNTPKNINVTFSKSLRPKQLPIVEKYLKVVQNETYGGGGIISVPCGYGKTVLALYLLARLGVKTLVVVHKEFLMNQWKERIEEFIPEARVGKIKQKVTKVEDKDIVIGMLQSISMIDYSEDIFKDFGFVIYDECHHLGAEVFSKALLKTNFKYLLGLSATPKRADGLSKVFEWYLGPMIYCIKKREQEEVQVKVINYFVEDEKYSKIVKNKMGKPMLPTMINNITEYLPRTKLIVKEIIKCLNDSRKILLLSDRRDHLKVLKEQIDNFKVAKPLVNCASSSALGQLVKRLTKYEPFLKSIIYNLYKRNLSHNATTGYYLGGMKQRDLEESEKADVILGTFSMASEGFDCRFPLNTIVLSSPKSNIEQAVGRILRQEASKRTKIPLIIDINDNFSLFARQTQKRIKFYKKNKYEIDYYDQNGTFINSDKQKNKEIEFLD